MPEETKPAGPMAAAPAANPAGGNAGIHFLRYGAPVIIVAAGIFVVSQLSATTINDSSAYDTTSGVFGRFTDEAAHFVEYAVLSALILRWILAVKAPASGALVDAVVVRASGQRAVAFSVLYAISDEAHQWFVDGRSVELLDLLVDGLGALIGAALYLSVYQAWRLQRTSPGGRAAPAQARSRTEENGGLDE